MTDEKREFKGVWFPKEVWLDERLTALEKMILIEIDSLDGEKGCYASNEYLAKFCQCSQAKVSGAISKLKKLNYVVVESFDGRNRVLRSCLKVCRKQPTKIYKADCENLEEILLDKNTTKEKSDVLNGKGKYPKIIRCECGGDMVKTAYSQTATGRPYYRCVVCQREEVYRG